MQIGKKFLYVEVVVSAILSLTLFLLPLLPGIDYEYKKAKGEFSREVNYKESAENKDKEGNNKLVIPVIGVDSEIFTGDSPSNLEKGVWMRPRSVLPSQKGNVILTGHRFKYTGFANKTFYNLDKVKVGDNIYIFWKTKKYTYKVKEIKVVNPTDTYIENDFGDERVTIYTCHPLWTAAKRLVLIALPV